MRVAAPTAGLHFSDAQLGALDAAGIPRVLVTLHVGAGTFLPIRTDDVSDHAMHAEWGEVTEDAARAINAARRVVAVGTTTLRVLETAADCQAGRVQPFRGNTRLFITPGYRFRGGGGAWSRTAICRARRCSCWVAPLPGRPRMRAAYAHAIEQGYRFYSYGDACLLERAA